MGAAGRLLIGVDLVLELGASGVRGLLPDSSGKGVQLQDLRNEHAAILEQGQTGSLGSVSTVMDKGKSDRHRYMLIFGGWSRDTAWKLIADQLHRASQELRVAEFTNNPEFATGPRRSMALMQFRPRSGEGFTT